MYLQDSGILLSGMAFSTLILTLFIFLSSYITTCFEMPGQTRIPQDEWRADNE